MIRNLSKSDLLIKTKHLVAEERRITLELLEHLKEIDRRLLYSEMGYGSLFEFCVKHLGLSEGSAHRRISTMRLSRDVPEAKTKLESGALSLSNAAKIHVAFSKVRSAKALGLSEKSKIIQECSSLTQNDCEKKLFKLLPELESMQRSEKTRAINSEEVELKIVLNKDLQNKIARLKNLLAHANPSSSTLDLIAYLIEKELKSQEKKRGLLPQQLNSAGQNEMNQSVKANGSSIPAHIRRTIWQRSGAKCEFSNCISTYKLEVDHITPKHLGGSNEIDNLRLLCRSHNFQQATVKLGDEIMQQYVPSLRSIRLVK